jgi:tRNA threonylcarbamoyladenosine biosynthesis protein TsaB
MKILALDTSTRFLSIGILDGDRICEYNLDFGRRHSALAVPTIERVVEALGWPLSSFDYLACGVGPGSFTGVRIACAIIKGLGFALRKPIIAVPSLDSIAANALFAGRRKFQRVIPMVDARRNSVYFSVYAYTNGRLKRQGPLRLAPISDALAYCTPGSVVLGDALTIYGEQLAAVQGGFEFLDRDCWYPTGRSIVRVALSLLEKNKVTDALSLRPVYLYPQDCQIQRPGHTV